MNRSVTVKEICLIALAVCINIAGGQAALVLRLPIYLDSIGTILIGVLLGPFYGMIPNLLSGIAMGMTADIYSLYFAPVGMVTGFMAGLVSGAVRGRYGCEKMTGGESADGKYGKRAAGIAAVLSAAIAVTVPGTVLSALICAKLFGGITSSGSSILVQLLSHTSLSMTASVFIVQIVTDYLDRVISLYLVAVLVRVLPADLKYACRRSGENR
ncbi:MAG: ECF transporter S component [Enterocloster sp.]